MRFRVRSVKNEPNQTLSFRGTRCKNHLLSEGYRLSSTGETFSAGEREGLLCERLLPYGNEDHIYLTAIEVSGRKILVAGMAGPPPRAKLLPLPRLEE